MLFNRLGFSISEVRRICSLALVVTCILPEGIDYLVAELAGFVVFVRDESLVSSFFILSLVSLAVYTPNVLQMIRAA